MFITVFTCNDIFIVIYLFLKNGIVLLSYLIIVVNKHWRVYLGFSHAGTVDSKIDVNRCKIWTNPGNG